MRILSIHNSYQRAGGEDVVFANEASLLRDAGHQVETLVISNDSIDGPAKKAAAAMLTIHNPFGRRAVARAIAAVRPDIVHVHNFFPLISPAVFDACAKARVPAVWTVHNFRASCVNGLFFRDGSPCEDCLGHLPLPAVRHACYRGSRLGSAAVAAMIAYHHAAGTWRSKVARFIALSRFSRSKLIAAGLPAERIEVKPNFVLRPRPPSEPVTQRSGALFVGRLSPEKGVSSLLEAWQRVSVPLTVIGDGPDRAALEATAPPHVRFLGQLSRDEVSGALASAQAIIVPSIWHEMFGLVAVEAMAAGTPVIAARIGSLTEIVTHGVDGLHFQAGNASDLARVAGEAFASIDKLADMGVAASHTFNEKFSPERNLAQLLSIYKLALSQTEHQHHGESELCASSS